MSKLILASASPRRARLLEMLGLEFKVCPADADESLPDDVTPQAAVELLARRKAEAVAVGCGTDAVVIAADTLVAIGGRILGKPRDETDAADMLRSLSGGVSYVYSGIALAAHRKLTSAVECTEVHFRCLDEREIARYIATGEPMDKAGAYGIQGRAGIFIRSIVGDYYNVVGLPLCRLEELSAEFLGCSLYEL